MRFPVAIAALATLSMSAVGQSPLATSLSATAFTSGGGNTIFFDLTATNGVEITSFDCNFRDAAGSPCGLNVYVRPGTARTNEGDPIGWSLVATDTGNIQTAGPDQATSVPLTIPICVPAGATVGFALESTNSANQAYIRTSGSGQVFSNADLTLTSGIQTAPPTFTSASGSFAAFSGAVHYNLSGSCGRWYRTTLVGLAEPMASFRFLPILDNQTIETGWDLRLNLFDATRTNSGRFAAIVLNVGTGGRPQVGASATIPGFQQLWAGSAPAGLATPFTTIVGAPDLSFTIPAGVFFAGDVLRFQGLVLDRAAGVGGNLPVVATTNAVTFTFPTPLQTCAAIEDFENVTPGYGNLPAGWSNGAPFRDWSANAGATRSYPTGPTTARSGSQYVYTETSGVFVGSIFELVSPAFTDQTVTNLNFHLSRIGADIGLLDVFMDDGTTLTPLATYLGPDSGQSLGGLEWREENLTLPSPLPSSYSFLFRYTVQPTIQSAWLGDCAIDRFCLN